MLVRKLGAAALVIALALAALAGQESARKPAARAFTFRQGQPIYIAAFHRVHEPSVYPTGARDRYVLRNDVEFEAHLRKEFEKKRVFQLADKLSEAEVVFLAYREEDAAEGYALAPDKYTEFKSQLDPLTGQLDLDALREAAYGRYVAGHFKFATSGRISNRLVKKFHEAAIRKS